MEPHQGTMTRKFRRLSRFYDLIELFFNLRPGKNPRCFVTGKIPDQELAVLDLCCGTGTQAIMIAEKNPHNRVIGVDLSP